ncbi:hypothetical protein R1flu_019787 [Riccia fluitans]|uniref:Protein kinase domain-containing protein n=1 Tax=Riccia fluitans TaxID=41844 RepID=A0ABD1ZJN5_9MARC
MEDPDVLNEHHEETKTNEHHDEANDDKDTVKALKDEIEALKKKVAEVEREREEQKTMKLALKRHAVRLGQALKASRELALEKGVDLGAVRDPVQDAGEAVNSVATDVPAAAVPREVTRGSGMSTPALIALKADAKRDGWLIQPAEVQLLDELGHGATADIYRAQWHGFEVAVKCLRPKCFGANTDSVDVFVREVEVLSKQRHPYILQLFGACLDPPEQAWIVTEFMKAGTLMEWLHGSKKREWKRVIPLPPLEKRLRIATEISIGMQYLHERKPIVMHRDLKPSNIFLDENLHVRIADFSFSRYKTSDHDIYTGETGTYLYMAPEVMRHEYYTETCDVYSFGVMLWELVTGNPPYIDDFMTPVQIAWSLFRVSRLSVLMKSLVHYQGSIISISAERRGHSACLVVPANRSPPLDKNLARHIQSSVYGSYGWVDLCVGCLSFWARIFAYVLLMKDIGVAEPLLLENVPQNRKRKVTGYAVR